tara:strand:- start:2039 stop:2725 length:687 start_codon:yes stop_codon:yes gene_type:complete
MSALRQSYSLIKRAYSKQKRNPITTASTLRLQVAVPVGTSKTTIQFPIIQGDEATTYAEAMMLNRADSFTATSMGLFIGGLTDAGVAVSAGATNYALTSYPAFSNGISLASGQAETLFYNSKINIAINNVQYLQNFDTYSMYNAGVSQVNRNQGGVANVGVAPTLPADSTRGSNAGFVDLIPTLQFSGTSKIDITLALPNALTVTTSAFILVLMFRGFLSLGASNLNR